MADKPVEHGETSTPQVRGEQTYVLLSGTEDFFAEPAPDAWGVMRTPFSPHIARMSAELAADGYELDIKPWIAAGWDDCIFIVEDRVVVLDRESDSRLAAIESEWKLHRAKTMIRGVSPISDLMRAVRQLFVTDLSKSIVMTNTMPNGQAIIAISFIGTTQKYYDWFTNFKFQQKTGMHSGFLALATQFEEQSTRILLPKLAAELGEETFSLADAILAAKGPEARISFWISGHSQGGAIVQTYTHLLMAQGVPAERIHAYSFAAPTVASADAAVGLDPKAYPIYNIVNMDDAVPRIGAELRLGMDWLYHPSNAFRKRHYRVTDEDWIAVDRAIHLNMQIQTTKDAIIWGIALSHLMRDLEHDHGLEAFFAELVPQLSTLQRVNLSSLDIANFLAKTLTNQLKSLTGEDPDETLCEHYAAGMHAMMKEYGAKQSSHALLRSISGPHRIRGDKRDEGYVPPYIAIVRRHLSECEQGIWLAEEPARCIDAHGHTLLPSQYSRKALPSSSAPLLEDGTSNTQNS